MNLSGHDKKEIRNKLFLRIPIIQEIMVEAKNKETFPMDILTRYLTESTSVRRSNVRKIVEYIYNSADITLSSTIQKNLKWK